VIVVAAILIIVAKHHHSHANVAATSSSVTQTNSASATQTSTSASTGSGAGSAGAKVITQINLSATAPRGKATAIADVLQEGSAREVAIVGQSVPANTKHNSYEVWLYNSPSDAVSLGFVDPGVSAGGRLSAAGPLPADASRYRKLIVTTETVAHPKAPGPILLAGTITGL
jgi:anti-sigma-K factor RskA